MADTFSMMMIVPLENRPVQDLTAKSGGFQYGAYFKNSDKRKRKVSKFWTNEPDFMHSSKEMEASIKISKEEKQVLKDLDDQFELKGHYWWIFPNGNYSIYRQFFDEERPLNVFLDQKLQQRVMLKKWKLEEMTSNEQERIRIKTKSSKWIIISGKWPDTNQSRFTAIS